MGKIMYHEVFAVGRHASCIKVDHITPPPSRRLVPPLYGFLSESPIGPLDPGLTSGEAAATLRVIRRGVSFDMGVARGTPPERSLGGDGGGGRKSVADCHDDEDGGAGRNDVGADEGPAGRDAEA